MAFIPLKFQQKSRIFRLTACMDLCKEKCHRNQKFRPGYSSSWNIWYHWFR